MCFCFSDVSLDQQLVAIEIQQDIIYYKIASKKKNVVAKVLPVFVSKLFLNDALLNHG